MLNEVYYLTMLKTMLALECTIYGGENTMKEVLFIQSVERQMGGVCGDKKE